MKKIAAVFLMLTMVFGLFSGCGPKQETPKDPPPVEKPVETTPQKEELKGTELTTFVQGYLDAKTKVWDVMSTKFEEEQNLTFGMATLGFTFADLSIIEIMMFDAITILQGDSYKGKLALSDIEGWKKTKGDIIDFGYDYTYPADKNQSKKGDHEVSTGKLDRKTGALSYEKYTERDGKKINKYIIEIVKNSDKSYSSQLYFMDYTDNSGKEDMSLNAYLMWLEEEDLICILAEKKDTSNIDFEYSSILNKKNVKPEVMVNGMEVVFKSSFIGGKTSFEQTENQ
jgi:hypothetical protein